MTITVKRDENDSSHRFNSDKDVDGTGINNGVRAGWAYDALLEYHRRTGDDNGKPDESTFQNLICNLMHLADRDGYDMVGAIKFAVGCYMDER
jgi:hypothetical protein